mmetsp:Transcript_77238/g.165585  ORF Transcript_77238/g.165585 Transcript_77238/m.165585 type:complete len:206 (-) Transcript_77238:7-624(-)
MGGIHDSQFDQVALPLHRTQVGPESGILRLRREEHQRHKGADASDEDGDKGADYNHTKGDAARRLVQSDCADAGSDARTATCAAKVTYAPRGMARVLAVRAARTINAVEILAAPDGFRRKQTSHCGGRLLDHVYALPHVLHDTGHALPSLDGRDRASFVGAALQERRSRQRWAACRRCAFRPRPHRTHGAGRDEGGAGAAAARCS